MNSNENIVNYEVLDLIEIYNFGFIHFPILVRLNNLKFWISNYGNFKQNFGTVNDLKWKNSQL
jgi:hypothetical protein